MHAKAREGYQALSTLTNLNQIKIDPTSTKMHLSANMMQLRNLIFLGDCVFYLFFSEKQIQNHTLFQIKPIRSILTWPTYTKVNNNKIFIKEDTMEEYFYLPKNRAAVLTKIPIGVTFESWSCGTLISHYHYAQYFECLPQLLLPLMDLNDDIQRY